MLTYEEIRKLKPKAAGYAVQDIGGLSLLVSKRSKRWLYRYRLRGRNSTLALGQWPKISIAAARLSASEARQLILAGTDPMGVRRKVTRTTVSVRAFGARWMRERVSQVRKEPWEVGRVLARDIYPELGDVAIDQVSAEDVRGLVFKRRDEGRPEAAALIRETLRRMYDYAIACEMTTHNPTLATSLKFVTQNRSRSRTLSRAEIVKFKHRARSLPQRYETSLKLLLLTLVRKNELLTARWEHIDLVNAVWEIPAELTKTGTPHTVYLSHQAVTALQILRSWCRDAEVVLPTRNSKTVPIAEHTLNKAMNKVDWGMPHFTPHDLRRTAATLLNEQGYNSDWIEKALNHSVRGIRGVYNRALYAEQRKQMLQEWADWLSAL